VAVAAEPRALLVSVVAIVPPLETEFQPMLALDNASALAYLCKGLNSLAQ
jgi:hypothetical protein